MSPYQDKSNKERGFTLIEALVSLVILTSAMVPAFILATDALRMSASIRDTLVGANLAQEGIEVVRAMRDANWFAAQPFDTGLNGCDSGCRVQWDSTELLSLDTDPVLKLDNVTHLYQYSSGVTTPFSRKITITHASTVELVITSEVTWSERTGPKSVLVESHLFDWLP